MKDNLYSSKSDVWAFAIVLWEIGTLGKSFCILNPHENLLKLSKTFRFLTTKFSFSFPYFFRFWFASNIFHFPLFPSSTGGFPYPTVSNPELLNFLKLGQRLERPENCSENLYELMLQCWATDPEDRPDFSDICQKLDPNKNKIYIDFSELSPNYVFPPTSEEVTAMEKPSKA
jgi:serine/threonine protein kinase